MPQETPISLRLQVYRENQLIQSATLERSSNQIGSLASSHIRIDDPSVSRIHAVIEKRGSQGIWIQDLGSEQGTWVNGKRVDQAPIQPGDVIQLGNIRLTLEVIPREQVTFAKVEFPPQVNQSSIQSNDSTYASAVEVCAYFDKSVVLNRALRNSSGGTAHHFTIGKSAQATLPILTSLPFDPFPIVRGKGTYYELLVIPAMQGTIEVQGEKYSLEDWMQSHTPPAPANAKWTAIPIQNNFRVEVNIGSVTLVITPIRKVKPLPTPIRFPWELMLAALVLFLIVVLIVWLNRPIADDSEWRYQQMKEQNPELINFPTPPAALPIPEEMKGKKGGGGGGAPGAKASGKEGKMGDKEAQKKDTQVQVKGPKDNTNVRISKDQAKEQAQDAAAQSGIVGILKETSQNGVEIKNVFSKNDALGQDQRNVLGNLKGDDTSENAYGLGGLGLVGSGPGGGGTSDSTIGLSDLGTVGKGSKGTGTGGGSGDGKGIGDGKGHGPGTGGYGSKVGVLKTRRATGPDVIPGTALVKGNLDKDRIRRVIRAHMNEVKFCYEKELQRNDKLQGRVTINFIISGMGKVISSKVANSTLGNPTTEQCIAQALRRWDFPAPEGGGIVEVSYPFVLKSAGAE